MVKPLGSNNIPTGIPDSEVWNASTMVIFTPLWVMVPPMLKPMPFRTCDAGRPLSIRLQQFLNSQAWRYCAFTRLMASPVWSAWSCVTSTRSTGEIASTKEKKEKMRQKKGRLCDVPFCCFFLNLESAWPCHDFVFMVSLLLWYYVGVSGVQTHP